MLDYGDIYSHELFQKEKLFPDFAVQQKVAAQEIYNRVFARCGVDIGMPFIDCIVDIGCGDGSLTSALARLANKRRKGQELLRVIGVDCSKKAIKVAKRKGMPHVQFIARSVKFPQLFAELKADFDVNWSRTALVILGHTWFHLEQDSILKAIRDNHPALLIVDVYQTWDATLAKLENNGGKPELEHGRVDPSEACTYWLQTRIHPNDTQRVQRGIWRMSAMTGMDATLRGDWEFPPTVQSRVTSEALFGSEAVRRKKNIFADARAQGKITGDFNPRQPEKGGCDYIARRRFRHISGWGEMECHVLVPRDKRAAPLNAGYFKAVQGIIRRLIVDKKNASCTSKERSMLALFDEPETWRKAHHFPYEGSREAVIVLPFDACTNFARVMGLFPKSDDKEISSHDLIVEMPKEIQARFPTAYGIFHTFEDRVSSPQGFPLHWAPDYEHAPIDESFNELETKLLGLKGTTKDGRDTSFLDGSAPNYFLLPVYFGSLPLFALALKFPVLFAPESTDYQVYFSALHNLHGEIKIALTDAFIQNELLSPWIAAALDGLFLLERSGSEGPDPLEKTGFVEKLLNELEERIFGIRVEKTDDPRGYCVAGVNRIHGVLGKEWKSWVLGVPSFPIKRMRSVEAENTRLWSLWHSEKTRAALNHELRISYWLQHGQFFEDSSVGGHEIFRPRLHRDRLSAMLKQISPSGEPDPDHLTKRNCGYFERSQKHFLLIWTQEQVRHLLACVHCNELLAFAADDEVNGCDGCQMKFRDLKATFCKVWENHGEGLRFSVVRLKALIAAAIFGNINTGFCEEEILVPEKGEEDFRSIPKLESWKKAGAEQKCYCRDDPSHATAEFVSAVADLSAQKNKSRLKKVRIEVGEFVGGKGTVAIVLKLSPTLRNSHGGSGFEKVRRIWRHLGQKEEALFGSSTIDLRLVVTQDKKNETLQFKLNNVRICPFPTP